MVSGDSTWTPSTMPSPARAEYSRATARALPWPLVDGTSAARHAWVLTTPVPESSGGLR